MQLNLNKSIKLSSLILLFFSAIILPYHAHAAFVSTPNAGTLITNGEINAIIATSTGEYIGGSFSLVGSYTGNGAIVASSTGVVSSAFPLVSGSNGGTVYTSVSDGSGGYYIGGFFNQVGSSTRNSLAHILANGSVDPNFNPNVSGVINAMYLSPDGSTLYIGGSFTTVGGVAYSHLAAINTANGNAFSAFAPALNGTVTSLVFSATSSTLYVGGLFTTIGSTTYNHLAAVTTASGTPVTTFTPSLNNNPNTLVLSPDGSTLYVGGQFTTIGSTTYNHLAAISTASGTPITSFNPSMNNSVSSLALSANGSILYVGGNFTTIGSTSPATYNYLGAVTTASGTAITAFNPNLNNGVSALSLSLDGSTLYVGGSFTMIGTSTDNYLGAVTTASGTPIASFNPGVNNQVDTIVPSSNGSSLFVGGNFSSDNSSIRNGIAAIDPTGTILLPFNPSFAGTSAINALALSPDGSTLYVGGTFTTIGTTTYNNLAALNTTTGNAVSAFNPSINSTVYSLALPSMGSILYVGGSFTAVGTTTYNRLAAINTSNGAAITAFNPIMNNNVYTLTASPNGSILYAGGSFTTVGGVTYNRLAAINTSSGAAITAFNPAVGGPVRSLALSPDGSTLYAGGNFTTIGGNTYNFLGAVTTASGTSITAFNPSFNAVVFALALSPDNSTLYAMGDFTTINSATYNYLGAVTTASGTAVSTFNPNLKVGSQSALAFSPNGSTLYAGGNFTSVGGSSNSQYLALFSPPSAPTLATPTFSSVSLTTATLNSAMLTDGGASSTIEGFNYGPTTAYGTTASSSGSYDLNYFNQSIIGLTCGTTYHVQAFAVSPGGTGTSSDTTFATAACPVASAPTTVFASGGGGNASAAQLSAILAPSAATTAYLNSLTHTQSSVQGSTKTPTITSTTFTRNLTIGSTGADVKALQKYLNNSGYTVAATDAGSPGQESTYFGIRTKAALAKFQAAHGIPATGYFGVMTRGYLMSN